MKDRRLNSLRAAAENGELRRRVHVMEGRTLETVMSAKPLRAKGSAVAEERDYLAAKCKEHALEVQCMPGFAEEAKSMRTRVVELEDGSKTLASKGRARCRTADMV